jgi:CDP-diacylglycerol--glycerol-3-phosphate 3-phosphatidyltransferase
MATIYDIKPQFQALLRPLVRMLASLGVTANQVTIAALLLSLLAGGALWFAATRAPVYLLGPVVLLVRMALNAIDGMLAREHGQKSPLGGVLNEVSDVAADAALYLPVMNIAGVPVLLVAVFVVLAALTELTGVVTAQLGASRRYDGPLGKSDRAFVFGMVYVLLAGGWIGARGIGVIVAVAAALSLLTIVNRSRRGLAEIAP